MPVPVKREGRAVVSETGLNCFRGNAGMGQDGGMQVAQVVNAQILRETGSAQQTFPRSFLQQVRPYWGSFLSGEHVVFALPLRS